ncbi:MAG: hypothetical protein IH951_15360 [Bacteroidetes bacterium]|nr:hypothetical protein [Bacteroidota bacterium]
MNKLERLAKPLLEREKIKEKHRKIHEWFFPRLNKVMEKHYPEHGWSKLPLKKKLEIFNRPRENKLYFRPNYPIPFVIPQKTDKYDKLYFEALRLYGDFIWEEIKRRREKEYLKSDVESKGMKGKYKYK